MNVSAAAAWEACPDDRGAVGLMIVSFNPASAGQVALVIYEWKDVQYLGAETPRSEDEDESPVRRAF